MLAEQSYRFVTVIRMNKKWESLFYTEEEFRRLYNETNGFNDDINRNHRVRPEGESFADFMDMGSDGLIQDHAELVRKLI